MKLFFCLALTANLASAGPLTGRLVIRDATDVGCTIGKADGAAQLAADCDIATASASIDANAAAITALIKP